MANVVNLVAGFLGDVVEDGGEVVDDELVPRPVPEGRGGWVEGGVVTAEASASSVGNPYVVALIGEDQG